MTYSVSLTGAYRPGVEPAEVHLEIGQVFKQDPTRIEQLIRNRAIVKRGIDYSTAERYRDSIERAGAMCAIEDENADLTLDDAPLNAPIPSATPGKTAGTNGEEVVLRETGPSLKAYAGLIVMGVLLLVVVVGLLILLSVLIKWKSTRYKLTDQRLFIRSGLISRKLEEIQLYRVKDVTFRQGILDRMLGIGSITVISADATAPSATLIGIENPEQFKEEIRSAYRNARQREGVRAAERIVD